MSTFDIDEELIRKLARLLDETGLNEVEYEKAGERIRLNRGTVASATAPAAAAPPVTVAPAPSAPDGPPAGAVLSPMVGTAYLSSEPGAKPFVVTGDRVSQGQTLLIIEAMKVMNPITAAHAGIVRQIIVVDGRPVEYGEILMVVE
ncbi:MAG: biotin/lipoyl-containing protein [Rhodospirillaceae bacterium]|nr:biotin/lipoyl-containing protein [Rhodospirillaceae bacterium]